MSRLCAQLKTLNLIEQALRDKSLYEGFFDLELARLRSLLLQSPQTDTPIESRLKKGAELVLDFSCQEDQNLLDLLDVFEELLLATTFDNRK